MYRLTARPDVVIRLSDWASIPRGHRWWTEYEEWLAAGNTPEPWETPEQTSERTRQTLTTAVQSHLDAAARDKGYDSIFTACTYAEEPSVAKFQAEGQAFRAWRSQVWQYCYQVLADVQAGTIPPPTVEDLIASLPVISAP